MSAVLVINADLGPLHRVSVHHAIRLLLRRKAEVHEAEPGQFIGPYPMPRVLRLVTYVVTRWRHHRGPAWSRRGVLTRDGHRCGYCGGHATTIDHIVPTSRGGRNTWDNTAAACSRCNTMKGDRDLAHCGLTLRIKPTAPSWAALTHH